MPPPWPGCTKQSPLYCIPVSSLTNANWLLTASPGRIAGVALLWGVCPISWGFHEGSTSLTWENQHPPTSPSMTAEEYPTVSRCWALFTQQSGFTGGWPTRQLSRPATFGGIHVTHTVLRESFSPVLFSNLTQAQEHVSKSAAHTVTTPGNNTGLPPPANMPSVDERFPWKDPFFSQDIFSLFMGTTAISHQSNVPRDSPPLSSHFNILIGKGVCREEGWLVVVAVGMILPTLNKCEEVYRLKCWQFWHSFQNARTTQPSTLSPGCQLGDNRKRSYSNLM